MRNIAKFLLIGALVACSTTASADYMRSFFADGVTPGVSQQGSALFGISNVALDGTATLSITLNNLLDPNRFASALLDGIDFTLTQMPTTATLTGVTAPGGGAPVVLDCTSRPVGSTSCPIGSGSSPYGWGSSLGST